MLKALKQYLKPINAIAKLDALTVYNSVKTFNKNTKIARQLSKWEIAYQECKELNLADINNDREVFNFLRALQKVDSSYASYQEFKLADYIIEGREIPLVYIII